MNETKKQEYSSILDSRIKNYTEEYLKLLFNTENSPVVHFTPTLVPVFKKCNDEYKKCKEHYESAWIKTCNQIQEMFDFIIQREADHVGASGNGGQEEESDDAEGGAK